MLTGELRNQIDRIWDSFWSGGIANPIEVIEQITYLLFLKRLDDEQTREDKKALTLGQPVERHIFPEGADERGTPYQQMRWQHFKNLEPRAMYDLVSEHVFPFLRTMGGDNTTYAHHMRDARFTIPTPGLLAKAVDLIDKLQMDDRDTKGDVYEYMLGKIASGQNGQFRTPRHIIQLMVQLTAPLPGFATQRRAPASFCWLRAIICVASIPGYLRTRNRSSISTVGCSTGSTQMRRCSALAA
jgi:type I restriction enzyme M protein